MAQRNGMKANFSKLSPLENDVISILWNNNAMYVRDLYEKLKGKRKVALTSVAVILDRLHKKGMVTREVETSRGGFRYLYSATQDKTEVERTLIENSVNDLINKFGKNALSYFDERFSK